MAYVIAASGIAEKPMLEGQPVFFFRAWPAECRAPGDKLLTIVVHSAPENCPKRVAYPLHRGSDAFARADRAESNRLVILPTGAASRR